MRKLLEAKWNFADLRTGVSIYSMLITLWAKISSSSLLDNLQKLSCCHRYFTNLCLAYGRWCRVSEVAALRSTKIYYRDNFSWFGSLFQIHVNRPYDEVFSVCNCFWRMFGKESKLWVININSCECSVTISRISRLLKFMSFKLST